jgi:hypothetical protein
MHVVDATAHNIGRRSAGPLDSMSADMPTWDGFSPATGRRLTPGISGRYPARESVVSASPIVLRPRLFDALLKPLLIGVGVALTLYWLLGLPNNSFLPFVPGGFVFAVTGFLSTRSEVVLDGKRVLVRGPFHAQELSAGDIVAIRTGEPGLSDKALSLATIFGPGPIGGANHRLALELRSGARIATAIPVVGNDFARWSEASSSWRKAYNISMYG